MPAPPFAFWQVPLATLLAHLQAGPGGLETQQAAVRLARCGPNQIQAEPRAALALALLRKLGNPLVLILLVASALSGLTGDTASFAIIAAVVLVSVTLDVAQEYRAGAAAARLRQSVAVRARVLRDGRAATLPVEQLVPGDVVLLAAGDLVPADGRLLQARDFFVDQALLTGEAYPVEKSAAEPSAPATLLAAPHCVLLGSSVVSGSATLLVCRTGAATETGGIAAALLEREPATAFEQGITRFGMLIMRMTFLLVLFVLLMNALFQRPWPDAFLFALALAVGLTPELLPMVVTVTLARGALRLAAGGVIVKRLAALHNLGSMDVLCTDKTGTLTEAKIRLERHLDAAGRDSERVIELAYLNSYFETGLRSPLDDAILEHTRFDLARWSKVDEVPFDFERRRVSVLLDDGTARLLVVKGAPEDILRLSQACEDQAGQPCPLDGAARARLAAQADALGRDGFRVLGIASRAVARDHPHAVVGDESALVFAGFAAFLDPPRPGARDALAALAADRVQVKVISGDSELVCAHLCAELGLAVTGMLSGAQIAQMGEQALAASVEQANLFCRVSPAQKNAIILALRRRGHVVGYLGDGINDAPSLHSADIGISVDSAVDVAKAAADMILMQHELGVLHAAVLEGRRTFGNIMKYIMMGTSSNFGNMFSMAGASLLLPFLPMLPAQVLLNNLLYDLSELPIPRDRVDDDYLSRPHRWDMDFIRNFMLVMGPLSSLFDLLTFGLMLGLFNAGEALFHTGWFIESIASQVLVIFIVRTRGSPFGSRPDAWLVCCSLAVVALAALLPFTPLAARLGLVAPPALLYLALGTLLGLYLAAAEAMKQWFFRHLAPGHS